MYAILFLPMIIYLYNFEFILNNNLFIQIIA